MSLRCDAQLVSGVIRLGFRSGSRTSCGHGSDIWVGGSIRIAPDPWREEREAYCIWMSSDRGFCDSTISYWDRCARRFLIWCSSTGRRLRDLEASDFDSYIAHLAAGGCSRRSISNLVKALRSFVRFAGDRGWCRKHLAEGIEGPRVYSDESLPMGPPWPDVERLIRSVETDRPRDVRGRAILMLLAIYGLRAGEVRQASVGGCRLGARPSVCEPSEAAQDSDLSAGCFRWRGDRQIFAGDPSGIGAERAVPWPQLAAWTSQPRRYTSYCCDRVEASRSTNNSFWSALAATCMCRAARLGRVVAQGDWGSSRPSWRFYNTRLCEGEPCSSPGSCCVRSGRAAMKLLELVNYLCGFQAFSGDAIRNSTSRVPKILQSPRRY